MSNTINEINFITYLNKLSNTLSYYFFMTIIPTGVILNVVSLYIFTRPRLNKTNMGYLLSILSIWHNVTLIFYVFVARPTTLFSYSINSCGFFTFLRRSIFNFSSWIQVLISIERYLNVYYSFKTATKRLINIVLICFFLLTLITNSTNLLYQQVKVLSTNYTTIKTTVTESCTAAKEIMLTTEFIVMSMRIYIPLILMAILNILIIVKLLKKNDNGTTGRKRKLREKRFTVVIILIDIIF